MSRGRFCRPMLLACSALLLSGQSQPHATPEQADAFVARAEASLAALQPDVYRAEWLAQTYVTDDTVRLHARLDAEYGALLLGFARESRIFGELSLLPDTARKLNLMVSRVENPPPGDPESAAAFSAVRAKMQADNAQRRFTRNGTTYDNYGDVRDAMERTGDAATLSALWSSWTDTGISSRGDYRRFVDLSNQGASALGYHDTARLWQSSSGLNPDETVRSTHALWAELKPFFQELHCYVRGRLNATYGDAIQPDRGPIRIDLTRNPVGMYWRGLAESVSPWGASGRSVTSMADRQLTARRMTGTQTARLAQEFYTSLGYRPLGELFWQRSLFDKPIDHLADCNGSSTPIEGDDIRLKFCTSANLAGLRTSVHEIGHVFYARSYAGQPFLYQNGASDAFHEALADFPLLSMNAAYFERAGLIPAGTADDPETEKRALLERALERMPLLAFAVAIEDWRWGVFSGSIKPAAYNVAWWNIVRDVQGLAPPAARPDDAFDAAAVPHILNNVPYNRYFFANLLQHQFHAAACGQSGWRGPLDRCSIYGSTAVGDRMRSMSALGASRPWQDALEAFTGQREITAKGLLDYYAPLRPWLKREIRGHSCGWQ